MIIVLTGGIGSGKSMAAAILNDMYGYPVYRADSAVKRLYLTDKMLMSAIESDAGQSFRTVDGIFSPNIMADYMVMFAPMAAGLAYYQKKTWQKVRCRWESKKSRKNRPKTQKRCIFYVRQGRYYFFAYKILKFCEFCGFLYTFVV